MQSVVQDDAYIDREIAVDAAVKNPAHKAAVG
jgi:hypothetical protein